MTVVAIHQPNYIPWLGYFHKMTHSDVFVLLDDVQFSKQSYTNRVKILGHDSDRWLSIPVSVSLGDTINVVTPAKPAWQKAHIDTLHGTYRTAKRFKEVWPRVKALYNDLPAGSLGEINAQLVRRIADGLGIKTRLLSSSTLDANHLKSDDRLAFIVEKLAPQGTYLSGKGGVNYQNPAKFAALGLAIELTHFEHPHYDQGRPEFVAGLSVLDAIFNVGWQETAKLIE
ncbi:MAG: WbqC family protein [Pseudomonadota bacterium]